MINAIMNIEQLSEAVPPIELDKGGGQTLCTLEVSRSEDAMFPDFAGGHDLSESSFTSQSLPRKFAENTSEPDSGYRTRK
jgi:hypothetical protein